MTVADKIREASSPLQPQPTGVDPVIEPQSGIRAVLFDVYGTMFISGSGEVGSAADSLDTAALAAALQAMGKTTSDPMQGVLLLREMIGRHHDMARQQGVNYPEVDICQVWQDTIGKWKSVAGLAGVAELDPEQLAVEFEIRANPTWPMPHLTECLDGLRQRELTLGIVSNAQFFTEQLFPAHLGRSDRELGFDSGLLFYSYRYGRAKPGTFLFGLAVTELSKRGISADEIIYVGNDMLNDVQAASTSGLRTALFAGDARSLRWRKDDPRMGDAVPDLVLTDLRSLLDCLPPV